MSDEQQPKNKAGQPRSAAAIARYERKRAETRRLQIEAMEMRKSGYSYRQIAAHQGSAATTVVQRVNRAARRDIPQELIETTRTVELDRFDQITNMNLQLMQMAFESGDIENFCKLQDRINAVHDRRSKIVPINQPTRLVIDQSVTTQTDQDRELTELLGRQAKEVEDKLKWLSEQTLA